VAPAILCTFLLSFLHCQSLSAQEPKWAASFASTGREALKGSLGRAPEGIAVYSGTVCSGDAAITLDEGAVLIELHRRGMVIFSGKSLDAFLTRNAERNTAKILMNWGEAISAGGAIISSTNVVQIRPEKKERYQFGTVAAALFFRFLGSKVAQRSIKPEDLRQYTLPPSFDLAAGQKCWVGDVLGIFDPAHPAVTFTIPSAVQ